MRRLFLFVFLASIGCASAFGQFAVLSSSPVDGAVGVPLLSTVSFTFSEPLDTTVIYENPGDLCIALLAHEPEDSFYPVEVGYSEDLMTINILLQHTANTDFIICVINAHSQAGHDLAEPFGLCYTTAAEHGPYTMSGTVIYPDGSPQFSAVVLSNVAENTEMDKEALGGVVVFAADGQYTMNYVRNGVYWPIAVKDLNHDGKIEAFDAMGTYDGNHDGLQDSIIVNGENLTGIEIFMSTIAAVETPHGNLPTGMSLAQNYPNPFNPETMINFTLPQEQVASLKVYDLLGREVAELANGLQSAGTHTVAWNAGSQPGGIYFYRLEAGMQSFTRKMLLVK